MSTIRRIILAFLISLALFSYALPAHSTGTEQHNQLPLAETNIERLTPRQYLYLIAADDYITARKIDKIAICESDWKMVKNSTSSAYGFCQFLTGTWRTTMLRMGIENGDLLRTDPFTNVDACVWLYEQDGIRHWLESQNCHKIYK